MICDSVFYKYVEAQSSTCLFGNVAPPVVESIERNLHELAGVLGIHDGDGDGGQLGAPVAGGGLRCGMSCDERGGDEWWGDERGGG